MAAWLVNCHPQADPSKPPSFNSVIVLPAWLAACRTASGIIELHPGRHSAAIPVAPIPCRNVRRDFMPKTEPGSWGPFHTFFTANPLDEKFKYLKLFHDGCW